MISHSVDIPDSDGRPLDADQRGAHTIQLCEEREFCDLTNVRARSVRIEDDVWIYLKASALKGVTVGRGAVIAAGAVVTRRVPPFALVAGNPARIARVLRGEDDRLRAVAGGDAP
jgi:acetyltransferase-like isoleucine patch superfamily enzyme